MKRIVFSSRKFSKIFVCCHFYSISRFFNSWKIFIKKKKRRIIPLDCEKSSRIEASLKKMFVFIRGKKREGTNERTSKNLQRRADVSRSIVKEQSNHASRKDPRQKEKRRERERKREGERTIAFSRRSNDRPWKGVAFQKDVCTWRRRIRNISSLSLSLSLSSLTLWSLSPFLIYFSLDCLCL